jgi:hypothetical protein
MKRLIQKITIALALLTGLTILTMPALVGAQAAPDNKSAVCQGVALTGGDCNSDPNPQLNTVITAVINIFSFVIGVAAVIMIMVGGFKYVTSSGDSNGVNSAKNTILYAIVGLVVVAFAQIIVNFVLKKATVPPATPAQQSAADAIKDSLNKGTATDQIKKEGQ